MGTPDGKLMLMHRFENLTIESYDVTSVEACDNSQSESDDVMGEPSFIYGVIKGTNRYVAYGSSKSQIGIWDVALRKHVRCFGVGESPIQNRQCVIIGVFSYSVIKLLG